MAARLVPISNADDPVMAPYTKLRDRELARGTAGSGRSDGLFVAEGEVVVRVLASSRQSRFLVRSLLVEERRVEVVADVIAALGPEVAVYVVPQGIMDAVVGFPIHRGILALGERGGLASPVTLLGAQEGRGAASGAPAWGSGRGEGAVALGLIGLTNHDNVGSIFRNAAAFGARGVLLDPTTCDPLYRKSVRVSVGAALIVPFARCASAEAMLETIAAAGWEALALTPRGEETLDAVSVAPPAKGRVLLLGAEGAGLSDPILARTRRVRIAMAPALDSLNVAVTSGIALYEATRARLAR